ncbi:MAG: hypothetical protein JO122_14755, partial [Acetobacteraceae bacterium]|nr:hypothetical protein [Acetobacteraceae bacterium]
GRSPNAGPDSGAVIEAMWKAGFFRLRGVLVGTLALQTYAGPLGVRLGTRPLMTQDVDFAQFWGISENIGETMAPPLAILRTVDGTFNRKRCCFHTLHPRWQITDDVSRFGKHGLHIWLTI